MNKTILKIATLTLLAISMLTTAQAEVRVKQNEYVIKLKEGAKPQSFFSNSKVKKIVKKLKAVIIGKTKFYKIQTHTHVKSSLVKKLLSHPMVSLVEPAFIYALPKTKRSKTYSLNQLPQDDMFGKLWGLDSEEDNDINAPEAWRVSDGNKKVIVAVVDTGVDFKHQDLKGKMWTNTKELNGQPGIDDDGNGYIDDINGMDFIDGSSSPMDEQGHGTHCAGTIGAVHNSIGVAGVARNIEIMAVKVLGTKGGTAATVAAGITYAVDNGAHVVSLSLGGPGDSEVLREAVKYAYSRGVILVVAAGNEGKNIDINDISYPAGYTKLGVIAVAAHGVHGKLAYFSNYGKKRVHVSAPGVDILSLAPGNKYAMMSGTSMATPHVSGIVAEMLSANPRIFNSKGSYRVLKISPAKTKEVLINTSRRSSLLKSSIISEGMVDMEKAVRVMRK